MNKILQLKHWQVFIILFLSTLLNNFEIEGNTTITDIFAITGLIIFFTILIAYGHSLYRFLPDKIELNYTLFVINSFLIIATTISVAVLTETNKVSLTGIYATPGFYIFYALLHTIAFPVKVLKSIELDREAKLGEYIGLFFMIVFWPFCIWFFQPRVNRIAHQGSVLVKE
ncbi:MAG: hypothetical protein ACO1OF_07520 [Adhaeribacter sp.]